MKNEIYKKFGLAETPYPYEEFCPGPPGEKGEKGEKGDRGLPGNLTDTALEFAFAQLANIINQILVLYPNENMTVYTDSFYPNAISGTPARFASSPEGTYGGIFVINEGTRYIAIPLQYISAIEFASGTVYNPNISYLPPPMFPPGFDKNILLSLYGYLPLYSTEILSIGQQLFSNGVIFKNEYGMVVQKSALSALDFVFIPVFQITGIYTDIPSPPPAGFNKAEAKNAEKGNEDIKARKSPLIFDKYPL